MYFNTIGKISQLIIFGEKMFTTGLYITCLMMLFISLLRLAIPGENQYKAIKKILLV